MGFWKEYHKWRCLLYHIISGVHDIHMLPLDCINKVYICNPNSISEEIEVYQALCSISTQWQNQSKFSFLCHFGCLSEPSSRTSTLQCRPAFHSPCCFTFHSTTSPKCSKLFSVRLKSNVYCEILHNPPRTLPSWTSKELIVYPSYCLPLKCLIFHFTLLV